MQSTYVDLYDGPSSLQKRDHIPTLREQVQHPLHYETERERHTAELRQRVLDLHDAQNKIKADSG